MSESPFEFEQKPFSSVPDAGCYISLPMHDEALEGLTDWIEDGEGIGMLTGAAGLGKTLLCHRLLADYEEKIQVVLLPHGNFPNVLSLLKALLFQLNCNYAGLDEDELRLELGGALQDLAGNSGRLLLMIDGAHELNEAMLNELQVLSSISQGHSVNLLVLLSGQLELEEMLTRRSLSALNQQLRTHQILENLTRAESADYLAGRVAWAGSDIEAVMTEEAVEMMTHLSDGVPRCLNRIAETSLRIATQRQAEAIDKACVREAYEDVRHLPLQWNAWPEESSSVVEEDQGQFDDGEESKKSSRIDDAITKEMKPHHSIPDLKSEAEEAGVEYAVAEFGGDEEDSEDQPSRGKELAENVSSSESVLDLSANLPQNGSDPEETPQGQQTKPSLANDSLDQESVLYREMQELVDIMEHKQPALDPVVPTAQAPIEDVHAEHTDYLQSSFNPVNIFAVDLPNEPFPPEECSGAAATTESSAVLLEEVQQIISEEVTKVAEDVDDAWEHEVSERRNEYDVIEPEAIPEISKDRPTFELDLPHREPQPRYRNLFRDLRRRRG